MPSLLLPLLLPSVLAASPEGTWSKPDLVTEPLVSGGHTRTQVAEALSPALPALRACFADPAHPVARAVTSLRADLTVSAAGRAGGVKVEALPVGDAALEACVQGVLQGLSYGAAEARSQVQIALVPVPPPAAVDHAVQQNAGVLGALRDDASLESVLGSGEFDSGVGGLIGVRGTVAGGGTTEGLGGMKPPKEPGPAVGGDPIILGALDKSLIDAVLKENMGRIHGCYVDGLRDRPDLAGKVTIKFVIAKDGTVSSAVVKSTTANDPPLEACMCTVFSKMQFPEPKGGGIVIVSYPFIFSPN